MTGRPLTTDELLDRLARRSEPDRADHMREFRLRWSAALHSPVPSEEPASGEFEARDNFNLFTVEPHEIRLRGMDQVRCLLVGGDGAASERLDQEWVRRTAVPGRISLVLTVSEEICRQARSAFSSNESLVFSKAEVMAVIDPSDGRAALRRILRERIPTRNLIPFNCLLPASANMFFGRQDALSQLLDEPQDSFAIAGSGRIGKTSVVRQYERALVRRKDPRMHCRHYIDFMDCGDRTDDGIAQFMAMRISPSRSGTQTKAFGAYNPRGMGQHSIQAFFRQMRHEAGRPLELLLDEVDEVCLSRTFGLLGDAAKLGLVRVVVCGRGVLYRAMQSSNSPLTSRFRLLRLEPLSDEDARDLVVKPLEDLGFRVMEPQRFGAELQRYTRGLPHAVQFFGRQIVELAIRKGTDTITVDTIRGVAGDFETTQFLIRPFRQLEGERRVLAAGLLQRGQEVFTVPHVREVGAGCGLDLDEVRALDLCNDLLLEGFFTWSDGHYALSSSYMTEHLRRLGLLT